MVLGNTMQLSELGFESDSCVEFDTFELLSHWHQLMIAVSRMEALICAQEEGNMSDSVSSTEAVVV